MAGTLIEQISDWAHECEPGPDRARAIMLMKHSLLDAIGSAYIAIDEECTQGAAAVTLAAAGAGEATLIGRKGLKGPLASAAFLNGTLVRALDVNDHLAFDPNDGAKLGGHPSDNLAALLAFGETHGVSGAAFLDAALLSYEMFGRFYRFLTPELPWDHTSAFGFSIPAAVSRMLGLPRDQTRNAIALSGARTLTLGVARRGQLSHSKFLASSFAAQASAQSIQFAMAGVTGPNTLFEDSRGYNVGVFHRHDGLEFLVGPSRAQHMIEGVTIKGFPGLDTTQAAEEAAINVARQASASYRISPDEIASLDVTMNDHPMTRTQASDQERRRPATRETADHSYYYLIAVALLDGEVTPKQFTDDRWHDPKLVDLMSRMTIRTEAGWSNRAPGGFPCAVKVTLKDGRVLTSEVAYATGHARNKMSREQVIAKFRRAIEAHLSDAQADAIIEAVDDMENMSDISALTRLLV